MLQDYTFSDHRSSIAGLKFNAPTAKWISANGFGTGKDNLIFLEGIARSKGMKEAETFLRNVRRLSAVETYLSSFVEGIASTRKARRVTACTITSTPHWYRPTVRCRP